MNRRDFLVRSGRPPKVTCALEMHLNRLVEQDPLQHGSLYSQWSCRELATGLAAHGTARQQIGSLKHFSRRPVGPARRRGLQPGGTRGRTIWTGTAAGGDSAGGAYYAA